jgi:hypothetical protein
MLYSPASKSFTKGRVAFIVPETGLSIMPMDALRVTSNASRTWVGIDPDCTHYVTMARTRPEWERLEAIAVSAEARRRRIGKISIASGGVDAVRDSRPIRSMEANQKNRHMTHGLAKCIVVGKQFEALDCVNDVWVKLCAVKVVGEPKAESMQCALDIIESN